MIKEKDIKLLKETILLTVKYTRYVIAAEVTSKIKEDFWRIVQQLLTFNR
jgi:hypothetical protein